MVVCFGRLNLYQLHLIVFNTIWPGEHKESIDLWPLPDLVGSEPLCAAFGLTHSIISTNTFYLLEKKESLAKMPWTTP